MTDPSLAEDPTVRAILNTLGEGVTLADQTGRIVFSNATADRILGVTATAGPPEEWAAHYGVFLPDSETPFPAQRYPLVRALAGEATRDIEMFVRNPNVPEGRLIAVTGEPMRGRDGAITGAAVVFRDVTQLRATEAQLRKTLKARDELSAFVVHDLKGPLTAILTLSDILAMGPTSEEEQVGIAEELKESARTMHRMVMDLLDLHVSEAGEMSIHLQHVCVADLLAQVQRAMSASVHAHGQNLVVSGCAKDLYARVDPDLFDRVLFNLVDNCVKYAPPRTQITLTALSSDDHGVVRFMVADEGPGVPEELREAIFEKYARVERQTSGRHRHSRGVGLSFSKAVVDAHGGRIWVEDNDPEGARFCVEVPAAD